MAKLTKEEILDQLKKIGVKSSSDLNSYLHEYKKYSSRNLNMQAVRRHQKSTRAKAALSLSMAKRVSQACYSFFPVLFHSLALSRIKAQKFIKK